MDTSTSSGADAPEVFARVDAALDLAKRGLRVFPLKQNEKIPLLTQWQHAASDDPHEITPVWTNHPGLNIGCFLDQGFVLDFDTKNGKKGLQSWHYLELLGVPDTYVQRTPSGGLHAFFRCKDEIRNSVDSTPELPGTDVRGIGGYVVGAGSDLPAGGYSVEHAAPIAEAPDWLVDMIRRPKQAVARANNPQPPLVELDTPAATARATAYLVKDAPEAVDGDGGDHTTYKVAARLKDFGVSADIALDLMLEHWNPDKAFPPWDARELQTKVRNAYAYGTAQPGRNSPDLAEVEFSDETQAIGQRDTLTTPARASSRALTFSFPSSIAEDFSADADYLIEGLYDRGAMVVTYGESNSGKTHVVLDQSFAIATGRPWAGKKTRQGLTVYVAAEGGRGITRRIMAHKTRYSDAGTAPLALVRASIDLRQPKGDAKALLALIAEAEDASGHKCAMVVVDTLARAMAGGDENSNVDMGELVRRCDDIRSATGATVHLIHHSGKDRARGARGHSSLRAATDTEIEIASHRLTVTKQRDMEIAAPISFAYEPVKIGVDGDGVPVTSVVLRVGAEADFPTPLTDTQAEVLGAAEKVIRRNLEQTGQATARHGDIQKQVNFGRSSALTTPHPAPIVKGTFTNTLQKLVSLDLLRQNQAKRYLMPDLVSGQSAVSDSHTDPGDLVGQRPAPFRGGSNRPPAARARLKANG